MNKTTALITLLVIFSVKCMSKENRSLYISVPPAYYVLGGLGVDFLYRLPETNAFIGLTSAFNVNFPKQLAVLFWNTTDAKADITWDLALGLNLQQQKIFPDISCGLIAGYEWWSNHKMFTKNKAENVLFCIYPIYSKELTSNLTIDFLLYNMINIPVKNFENSYKQKTYVLLPNINIRFSL